LLGSEEALVLHGGGNTSVKGTHTNILGESVGAIYVKASGSDMGTIEPEGHPSLDFASLRKLRALEDLDYQRMMEEFRTRLFNPRAATPSLETLAHAFLPLKFIDHTHADAILALTNQADGERLVREALGYEVIVLPYIRLGFKLAKAVAATYEASRQARGMVWIRHGIVTWGETAQQSYSTMIELMSRAGEFAAQRATNPLRVTVQTPLEAASKRVVQIAPVLRGLLAQPSGDPDRPYRRVILLPLTTREVLDFVDSNRSRELALTPPLTSDHLIRTKGLPLWVNTPCYDDAAKLRERLSKAIQDYSAQYEAYVARHAANIPAGVTPFDSRPRVILLPGLGTLFAGKDVKAARIGRDITAHTLAVKSRVAAIGNYQGLSEEHLFEMEYHSFQQAKLGASEEPALAREVALVTGAAGAIGSAICEGLLEQGCHVAATDLAEDALQSLVDALRTKYGEHVVGVRLDVTDPASVSQAFAAVIEIWGGIDLVVVNAGIAMVVPLAELSLDAFRRLERVNVEDTLLVISEAGRHFKAQGTGGDIILVSTKNVFAPGAKFGAYSATKAAAHQLAGSPAWNWPNSAYA
jgi:rhamnose utilization protein RhaD (predicted bifunctional aldolase and dehydrogenase)